MSGALALWSGKWKSARRHLGRLGMSVLMFPMPSMHFEHVDKL